MDTLYRLLEWNPVQVGSTFQGGVGGVLITSLWTFIYTMISFCLLIASTVPHHTDALRLIDDVGLGGWGGWGGVNNVPLDIHLHDDFFLLIASTVPCHTDALRLIDDVGLGWGGSFIHSFIHSFISFHVMSCHVISFHSFIHSFSRASSVHSRGARAQPSKSMRVYRRGKFRVHSRGSALPNMGDHGVVYFVLLPGGLSESPSSKYSNTHPYHIISLYPCCILMI